MSKISSTECLDKYKSHEMSSNFVLNDQHFVNNYGYLLEVNDLGRLCL